jgi:hypothetical protein
LTAVIDQSLATVRTSPALHQRRNLVATTINPKEISKMDVLGSGTRRISSMEIDALGLFG